MLEITGLTKRFKIRTVVDAVSFKLHPGEVLGYLGPNGAGKSTTVKMLTGLLPPTSGHIFFQGRNIQTCLSDYKKVLGYVPEEPQLYPYLSGWEYLQLVGRLRGIQENRLKDRMNDLLTLFKIHPARYMSLSSYSKGMKQKVLIIAALMHDPEILIFDEPLSGLDVTSALVFRHLVNELRMLGKVILYSSHVLEVVEKLCSRVMILHQGKVVANDSVSNLRHLMHLPSLEEIFTQLAVHEDPLETARQMAAVIQC
jgi:ABC-2 type transport system ATP-binding protein